MKIASGILNQIASALPGSSPEINDTLLNVPNAILLTTEPIAPNYRIIGSGGTSEASMNSGIQINRNNVGAAFNTFFTLSRGLYDLDLFLTAKFNYTQTPGTTPIIQILLTEPTGSGSNPLLALFANTNTSTANRKIRLLLPQDNWLIRLYTGAIGVAENVDALGDVQLTKILTGS